jgi:hypothetical protein
MTARATISCGCGTATLRSTSGSGAEYARRLRGDAAGESFGVGGSGAELSDDELERETGNGEGKVSGTDSESEGDGTSELAARESGRATSRGDTSSRANVGAGDPTREGGRETATKASAFASVARSDHAGACGSSCGDGVLRICSGRRGAGAGECGGVGRRDGAALGVEDGESR